MSFERLEVSDSLLELAPDVGGGIARLRLAGRDILRPAPAASRDLGPLDLAEFPMAPWVNRIAGGQFAIGDETMCASLDPAGDPSALHGLAWRSVWSLTERTEASLSLQMDWTARARWPFAFEMRRRFEIGSDHLCVDADLRNVGPRPMPAALGFHPYFPAEGASLRAQVSGAWATAGGIPTTWSRTAAVDQLAAGTRLRALDLDHCFTGWDGRAEMTWPTHRIAIDCSPSPGFLQIYSPPHEAYVCVEPQTAMPDAFNRPPAVGGMRWLAPGEAMQLRLKLTVIETA